VKQLQTVYTVSHLDDRRIKREGIVDQLLKGIRFDILPKKGGSYSMGNGLKVKLVDGFIKRIRQNSYTFRHIQAPVNSQAVNNSGLQTGQGRLVVGAVIVHITSFYVTK
jgi:hypothetical protein